MKIWVDLWRKEHTKHYYAGAGPDDDWEQTVDLVHIQWTARIADGLRDELFLLGTVRRRQTYISTVTARRVEIPRV